MISALNVCFQLSASSARLRSWSTPQARSISRKPLDIASALIDSIQNCRLRNGEGRGSSWGQMIVCWIENMKLPNPPSISQQTPTPCKLFGPQQTIKLITQPQLLLYPNSFNILLLRPPWHAVFVFYWVQEKLVCSEGWAGLSRSGGNLSTHPLGWSGFMNRPDKEADWCKDKAQIK